MIREPNPSEVRAFGLIDSLGAIASSLSKDEVGGAVANALSLIVAEGVETLSTYHPRKATSDNKQPRKLSDIYGSRWITALAGSVISLWGEPGDPIGGTGATVQVTIPNAFAHPQQFYRLKELT